MINWDFKTLFERKEETVEAKDFEKKKKWENYVWIDGYKGTDADMSCTVNYERPIGHGFTVPDQHRQQYELNKTVTYDDNPKICESGFHFCASFTDVFYFRPLTIGARYFKVKGFVKEKDVKEFSMCEGKISKFAAKEIILTEEIVLDYDFLKENYLNFLRIDGKKVFLNKEELEDCFIHKKYTSEEDFVRKRLYEAMNKAGYSDIFTKLIMNKKSHKQLLELLPVIEALDAEGVSKDMEVYTLLTWGNK